MLATIIISLLTCFAMILGVMFKPQLRIKLFGKVIAFDTFWVITLIGALTILLFNLVSFEEFFGGIAASSSMNPIKILILFLSLTFLSIVLDHAGFFRYCAELSIRKTKGSQYRLFMALFITVSVLTVFTSNDIIILTFTPFILYFSKEAKINPLPFLFGEFVAANTWSMMLYIGNPTNLYLAAVYNVDFVTYFLHMVLPTLVGGMVALALLLLIFRKSLHQKMESRPDAEEPAITDPFLMGVSLLHLLVCTILLALSSLLSVEMWKICLFFAISLSVIVFGYELLAKKKHARLLRESYRRVPWTLVPFVLSMFLMVLALDKYGIMKDLGTFFASFSHETPSLTLFTYGISSFLGANLINNIPMTVGFSRIMASLTGDNLTAAIYGTTIGSNIGAYLTPIGALAGIMWMSILKKHGVSFSFSRFSLYGILISVAVLLASLVTLSLILF
jgi:arsenical pump membrane protein